VLRGNRVLPVVVGVVAVAVLLTGCSGASGPLASSAIAAGQQAVSPDAPTPSPTPLGGWTSAVQCTPEVQASIESKRPAGTTLTPVDPASISGPLSDPTLNAGDVATCAFTISSGSHRQNQEFFFGMPQPYYQLFVTRLLTDGFTGRQVTTLADGGIQQLFTKGNDRVIASYTPTEPGLLAIFG
jgi:hypothetical protein